MRRISLISAIFVLGLAPDVNAGNRHLVAARESEDVRANFRPAPFTVPDAASRERIRTDATSWNRFRVVTARARFEVTELRMDSLGVVLGTRQLRPSVIVAGESGPDEPRRIRWSDIERIEGTRSHAVRGMSQGIIAGGMVGISVGFLLAVRYQDERALGALGAIPAGMLLGGLIGASLGSSSGWSRIYP